MNTVKWALTAGAWLGFWLGTAMAEVGTPITRPDHATFGWEIVPAIATFTFTGLYLGYKLAKSLRAD